MTAVCDARGLDAWFPHKVCVNLDRRPERWAKMADRFAALGITNVVRFSALDGERLDPPRGWRGSPGAYGCLQSNLAVVREARDRGWPSVLLLEDDVEFDPELDARLPAVMGQLPDDWDMLFLGAMHRGGPVRVREHLLKLTASTSTYAYAVRDRMYEPFLTVHAETRDPIDVSNRILQERFNCYCAWPHLAWVDAGESDTLGRRVNPWWLKESLILGGADVDDLQARTLVIVPHEDGPDAALARRNLTFAAQAYRQLLDRAGIVIVGSEPALESAVVPAGCARLSLGQGAPVDRARAYNAAIERYGRDKDFYVCAHRDVGVTWDVRASLLKCLEHDLTSSARHFIDLNDEETSRFVSRPSTAETSAAARSRQGLCAEGCVIARDALLRGGGWKEDTDDDGETPTLNGLDALSMFDSPAVGLRLWAGRSAALAPRGRRAC